MISIDRLKEMALEDIENNPQKHLEEYTELLQQLDQLKAENDEFKKWKETTVELFDRTCRCKHLNEENAHCSFYDRECISINQCLYKNQQTLTEIKEICEKESGWVNCSNNMPTETAIFAEQILRKISEVIE